VTLHGPCPDLDACNDIGDEAEMAGIDVVSFKKLEISLFFFLPLLLVNQKLPHTMSPEYQAASRAYMRYHNMNPIYGVSSK